MTLNVPVLSLISNNVRMGSSCLAMTRPTIMIYESQDGSTYIIYCFSLNFTHVVWSWRCLVDHLHCDWRKNAVFPFLTPCHVLSRIFVVHVPHAAITPKVVASNLVWNEESTVVVCKLQLESVQAFCFTGQNDLQSFTYHMLVPRN